jgi:hypothetical protein
MPTYRVTSEDSQPIHFKVTPKKFFILLVVNTLIALFIFGTYPGITTFPVSFVYSQCIGISIAACVMTAVRFMKTRQLPLQMLFLAGAILIGAVAGIFTGSIASDLIAPGVKFKIAFDQKNKFYLSTILYALLFGFGVSYVFISLQRMSDDKIRKLDLAKNAAITEIKLLQSQMEPHFLFNTLSNILGLIDTDPGKARRMLESFTSFLRSSLVRARSETITLSQELDVVKNYLDVFSVRMGDRLRFAIDIPDDLRHVQIPPLLIQPLVENAVKHGLEPLVEGGVIAIQAVREGDTVIISVTDSGSGIREKGSGNGIGLANIRKRLELMYGDRGKLLLEPNEPCGLKAAIEIPYETGESDHR